MLTELPVGNPGIAFPVTAEGKGIYKYGLSVPELDIIGADPSGTCRAQERAFEYGGSRGLPPSADWSTIRKDRK